MTVVGLMTQDSPCPGCLVSPHLPQLSLALSISVLLHLYTNTNPIAIAHFPPAAGALATALRQLSTNRDVSQIDVIYPPITATSIRRLYHYYS
jgi:hypothetical protein